jgi:hypothetical protein
MFKNGFIHRMKTNLTRPYAVERANGKIDEPFYDSNDDYIDSDDDFD